MACCGSKREAARSRAAGSTAPTPAPARSPGVTATAAPAAPETVALRFLGGTGVRIRGTVSGQVYLGDPASPAVLVAAADAPGLVRSGLFGR